MPKGQDRDGSRKTKAAKGDQLRSAGGSYGDQQPQYGTSAPRWQEPMPGRDERGDFGAGGEAFGSTSGQGRYGAEDQARRFERPAHPAWQPFGQPEENHPDESRMRRSREASNDPQYRNWGDRAMRQHDDDYRAYRAEQLKKQDAEFEEWRKSRSSQSVKPTPSKD